MKLKEKAEGLVDRYYHLFSVELENTIDYTEAKQCALIADSYAIEFGEYLRINYYETINNCWVSWDNDKDPKRSEEILEIFKKEKRL